MDVLFNSIDVRDLLSSHDLDESSPLSAPDLRLLIDRLQVHSLHIKSKVRHYVLSHHHDFASLFAQCSDAVSTSQNLSDRVSDLLTILSDHPIVAEIRDVVEEIGQTRREAREKRELLDLVRAIVELSEELRSVWEDVGAGRVVEAAQAGEEAEGGVAGRRWCGGRASGVWGVKEGMEKLQKRKFRSFYVNSELFMIQDLLVRFMENAVRFDQQHNEVRVNYLLSLNGIEGVELRTVLKAMDVVGILDYGLAKVADKMIKYAIIPVVKRRSNVSFVEDINQEKGGIMETILRIVPSSDPEIENVDGESIFSAIIHIIEFIYRSLFF
ncbi:centromere/kinetochore protein, putative [Actinidia rufa]|uniref:Centromere/kinetochore protein, putative n=1 Tax=Actinidia rufa TaxID=165716 RepID=A0A7J0FFV5_9ERIC|nr:centromere/kinetochore protein, putative [Actinidia rufa]